MTSSLKAALLAAAAVSLVSMAACSKPADTTADANSANAAANSANTAAADANAAAANASAANANAANSAANPPPK